MTTPIITRFVPGNELGSIAASLLKGYVSIDGDTLVLTYKDASDEVRTLRFVGVIQPGEFQRRAAVSPNAEFTAAEFIAGSDEILEKITPPISTGAVHIGFWQPATERELTYFRTDIAEAEFADINERNSRYLFGLPQPLTVDGVNGYYWSSLAQMHPRWTGIPWVIRSDGATYPPYSRFIGWSEDRDIDETDFVTGTEVFSDTLSIPVYTGTSTFAYLWIATRADQAGFPNAIIFGTDGRNVTGQYPRRTGTITHNGIEYVVMGTTRQIGVGFGGSPRPLELRY